MPVALSYPGVYIEEIPSGVRTITGVATSITAFVGRALRGPTNKAVTINSFADFERIFGGLWVKSTLGFAVRDFYLNGGAQAIIVRLFRADEGAGAKPAKTKLAVGGVPMEAAYEGAWGAYLRASTDKKGISDDVAQAMGVDSTDLFNVTVRDAGPGGTTEQFLNVTVVDSSRRIDKVLASESRLVRWDGTLDPNSPPAISEASDPVTAAEQDLAAKVKALNEKRIADPTGTHTAEETAVNTARTTLDTAQQKTVDEVSNGQGLNLATFLPPNGETEKKGLHALEQADLFNLLCLPPYRPAGITFDVDTMLLSAAVAYCDKRRAMLLVDPPSDWNSKDTALASFTAAQNSFPGVASKNAAIFFPRVRQPNPLRENQMEEFVPCGAVAGIFARTDTQRGVWKAPAGIEATLVGVPELEVALTDAENGELNKVGVNCLRAFPIIGRVVWGSRTLRGADQLADEWKYVPVRRTALFIEESLYRGTQWVVFEPNDEPLWAQIRLNVGAFLQSLFRQGAFQGRTPREAYFVKCDKETTTQDDINKGIVNIIVGFAPLKPAEFVVIRIQQMAGQIET
jgi:phage tail sheath protein FI